MSIFSGTVTVHTDTTVVPLFETIPDNTKQIMSTAIISGSSILEGSLRGNNYDVYSSLNKLKTYINSPNYVYGSPSIVNNYNANGVPQEVYNLVDNLWYYDPNRNPNWQFSHSLVTHYEHSASPRNETETNIFWDRAKMFAILMDLASVSYYTASHTFNGDASDSRYFDNKIVGYTPDTSSYYDTEVNQYESLRATLDGVTQIYGEYNPEYFKFGAVSHLIKFNSVYIDTYDNSQVITPSQYKLYYEYNVDSESATNILHSSEFTNIQEGAYPILPIRTHHAFMSTKTSQELNNVTKAMKIMNLNLLDLESAIKQNPDYEDIKEAIIMFGTPTTATSNMEIDSLIHTCKYLNNYSYDYREDIAYNEVTYNFGEYTYILKFKDISLSYEYNTNPQFSRIYEDLGDKEVGAVYYTIINEGDGQWIEVPNRDKYRNTRLTLTMPDPDGYPNSVYKCVITGLTGVHATQAFDGLHISTFNPDSHELLIPLLENGLNDTNLKYRGDIILKSIHIVANSVVVSKSKWYENSIFRGVLQIIGVVLFVVNPYVGALTAALTTGGMMAIIALVKIIGIYALSNYAVEFLISRLGKFGMVLAVVLAIAISVNVTNLQATLAQHIHDTFTKVVEVVQVYNRSELNKIVVLNDKLEMLYTAQKEKLDSYKIESNQLNWFNMTSSVVPSPLIFNESPSEFYKRTSTTISLPDLTNGMVSNYYDTTLQLPKYV